MATLKKWFLPMCFMALVVFAIIGVVYLAIWLAPATIAVGHGVMYTVTNPLEVLLGLLVAFTLAEFAFK